MKIETSRFGEIEIESNKVITFKDGLPGFDDYSQYILIKADEIGIMYWLQAVDEPEIALCLANSFAVLRDYHPEVTAADIADLETTDPADIIVLTVLVVPEDVEKMTGNLMAPVLINHAKKIGKQLILADDRYSARYSIFNEIRDALAEYATESEHVGVKETQCAAVQDAEVGGAKNAEGAELAGGAEKDACAFAEVE